MYEGLVNRLRTISPEEYGNPLDFAYGAQQALCEAADAIEELLQKEKFHAFLWNVINPNDMQLYLEMYHSGNEKEET